MISDSPNPSEVGQNVNFTVTGYSSTIFDKLDVTDHTQAALYAVKHKLAEGR